MNDLISVIMPTYNRANIIGRAINSVLKQSYKNFELIIVDDGSKDNTYSVIKQINDKRIKYYNYDCNRGANFARNYGLKKSTGNFIAFLDSDNVWGEIYLELRIKKIQCSQKNVGAVFGCVEIIRQDGFNYIFPNSEICANLRKNSSKNVIIEKMLCDNIIDTNTILIKKECIVAEGNGFDENLERLQDWEYFFRLLCFTDYDFIFSDDCLLCNYLQSDSITRKDNELSYWKTRFVFFEKYKEIFIKYNFFEDGLVKLCSMPEYLPLKENLLSLFNSLNKEELIAVVNKNCQLLNENQLVPLGEYSNLIFLERLMIKKQNGLKIDLVLKNKGYKNIAVYGYGKLCKILLGELNNTECNVKFIIDTNPILKKDAIYNIPIILPDKIGTNIDAVIVTILYDFEAICKKYKKTVPFISISNLI